MFHAHVQEFTDLGWMGLFDVKEETVTVLPLLKNYEIAKENIKLNNYSNIITLVLASCSAKEGSFNITAYWQKGIGKQIYDDSKEGTTIPLLTLEQILEQNNVGQRETVLKMDCEGCDSILRRFSNILIEYLYGFNDFKERLDKCNFDIFLIKISGEPGGQRPCQIQKG
jgi:FkbM family methyltransferase